MSEKWEVVVAEGYDGPSIIELESILDEVPDPVRVRWGNTRDEVNLIRKYSHRHLVLCVDGFPARDRVAATFGLPLSIEPSVLERTRLLLLNVAANDWRGLCAESKGGPSLKHVLLKLVADSLRKGNRPALAEIMEPLWLRGIDLIDVDVLLRLKSMR
jgi:hypothetical protein